AISIIQNYKNLHKESEHVTNHPDSINSPYEVVTLDGVFIGTTQTNWETHRFDEKTFKGFHGYDMDFSLQLVQHKKLYVVFDILLEHFSEGNPNRDWMSAAIEVSDKWKKHLPRYCITNLSEKEKFNLELKAKMGFKKRLKGFGYKTLNRKLLYLKYL